MKGDFRICFHSILSLIQFKGNTFLYYDNLLIAFLCLTIIVFEADDISFLHFYFNSDSLAYN